MIRRIALALVLLFLAIYPAAAQWQVTNHGVPIGRGPGVQGFNVATTGTAGRILVDQGAGTDPIFRTVSGDCSLSLTGVITCAATGSVTSVSVTSANGFTGSVANATTTPAISITTTLGVGQIPVVGVGGAISSAPLTGAGNIVLATSPTLVSPALGTPSSVVLTNGTGLPLTTGVTGVLPTANGGEANVANRTAMGLVDTTKNTVAWLTEAGRQGWFQWSSTNFSTQCTADTQQGIYVPSSGSPTCSGGAWVRQFTGPYVATWFGALGDNSTDNQTAIQGAIDAIPSTGGTLYFPIGNYRFSGTLNAGGRTAFLFQGAAPALPLQTNSGSILTCTQSGAGDCINLRGTTDSGLEKIAVVYTNAAYTGVVVNMGVSAGSGGFMTNVFLRGSFLTSASALLNLDKMVDSSFYQVNFYGSVNNVIGQAIAGGSYSNVASFDNCVFYAWTTAAINAPGDTWLFKNSTFEVLSSAAPVFLNTNSTFITSLTLVNSWFGDTTANVVMMDLFNVSGLVLTGNHADGAGFTTTFLKLTSTGGNLNYGIALTGNQLTGFTTGIDGNSSTTNGVSITGNNFGNTTSPIIGMANSTNVVAIGNNPNTANNPRGVVPTVFETVLLNDFTGSDVNTAQPIFSASQDAFAAEADSTYEFEAEYFITRAAGSTSHTTAVLFGGTATYDSVAYVAQVTNPTGNALANVQQIWSAAATAVTLTAANTSTTENLIIVLKGRIRTNASGTLIPQLQYSAAPGGAPTIKANSAFLIWRIGSDQVVTRGPWS